MTLLSHLRRHPLHRRIGALALGLCLLGWAWVLLSWLPQTTVEVAPPLSAQRQPSELARVKSAQELLRVAPPAAGFPPLRTEGLEGSWGLNSAGQLQPSLDLRKRFDHLLSRRGEQNLLQLRASIQQQLATEAEPEAAAQVLGVWDHYLRLQLWPWKTEVALDKPETWRKALSERSRIRRDLLGPSMAEAFYGAEEREFRQWIEARAMAASSPLPSEAPVALSDSASREAALSEEWQRWERRLEASRRTLEQVQQEPDLTQQQRRQAVQRHFTEAYQGGERQRAEALLSAGAK